MNFLTSKIQSGLLINSVNLLLILLYDSLFFFNNDFKCTSSRDSTPHLLEAQQLTEFDPGKS